MAQSNLEKLNCAEATIKTLIANGIDTLYCLPGVQNDDFFDALHRVGGAIKPVNARHEQATAYMALGAAMATGKPQAYCVVPGPGFLNTTTALATAQSLCAPVLAISGQIFEQRIGKGLGFLHEIPNQLGIMKTLTKWAAHIDGPQDAPGKAREAFKQLLSGTPGPVGIECGWDMWKQASEVALDLEPVKRVTPTIDEDAIEAAAKLLAASKRPLITVGGGAQDASEEVRQLAEMLQAPVMSFRTGSGVFDHRHELALRVSGGYHAWKTMDLVFGIGTRLHQLFDWGHDTSLKIVHLDIDPTRPGRIRKVDAPIIADAKEGLRALLKRLPKDLGKRDNRKEEIAEYRGKGLKDTESLAPQRAWINEIRKAVPEDGIVVEELTQISYCSRDMYPVYKPRTYIASGYQGTLGWGLNVALGVKTAKPDTPVISVSGDGGFMFGVQELATAAKYNIPVVSIVFTDNAYGNVRRMQQLNYDGRVIASDLKNPDFVKLGESFGVRSVRAKDPAGLGREIGSAIKHNGPSLIEVPVGEFPDPWGIFFRPKARG